MAAVGDPIRIGTAAALTIALLISGCGQRGSGDAASDVRSPTRGGTLHLVGRDDIDHLNTSSGYTGHTWTLLRAFTRQLVTYPPDTDFDAQATLAADLATVVPTFANGGISADGKRYTFHLRRGVNWSSTPPRAVTAPDVVRGIKLLCNPVSPTGAPRYYESTIAGMEAFCAAFAKVPGTAVAIKQFVNTHELSGVNAPDDSTVLFTLGQPASDFLRVLAMPFASPLPVEYLDYVPDGAEARTHTLSDGPYRITQYIPNREIDLGRNPAWNAAADPLHAAYVDSIHIVEGIDDRSVQQQLEAGIADMDWDERPPTADLPELLAANDPKLVLGLPGDHFVLGHYIAVNMLSPNAGGALRKLEVRQAIEYAVDKAAVVQQLGGPKIAQPMPQAIVSSSSGFVPGFVPYPTPGDRGDTAKARALLHAAGFSKDVPITLLYVSSGPDARLAQTIQASLGHAGFTVRLLPATSSDFYAKYVGSPDNARRGVWDLALSQWAPDWFGNNGRGTLQVLYDGRAFGPNTSDYGDYDSDVANAFMDQALHALTPGAADSAWTLAARQVILDAAVVPLAQQQAPIYHSARVQHCVYSMVYGNCDVTQVWLRTP